MAEPAAAGASSAAGDYLVNKARRLKRWVDSGFETKELDYSKIRIEDQLFWQTVYSVSECVVAHPGFVAQLVGENVKLENKNFQTRLGARAAIARLARLERISQNVPKAIRVAGTGMPLAMHGMIWYDMCSMLPVHYIRWRLQHEVPSLSEAQRNSVAGAVGSLLTTLTVSPQMVVARNQIVNRLEGRPHTVAATIAGLNQKGRTMDAGVFAAVRPLPAYFSGVGAILPLSVASGAVRTSAYFALKDWGESIAGQRIWVDFLAGGVASAVMTASFGKPFSTIINKRQLATEEYKNLTYPQIVQRLIETEGVKSLWKGFEAQTFNAFWRMGVFYSCFAGFASLAMEED